MEIRSDPGLPGGGSGIAGCFDEVAASPRFSVSLLRCVPSFVTSRKPGRKHRPAARTDK
jgi:hypothetical protein